MKILFLTLIIFVAMNQKIKKYKDFRKQKTTPNRLKVKFPRKNKLLKEIKHLGMGVIRKRTVLIDYL